MEMKSSPNTQITYWGDDKGKKKSKPSSHDVGWESPIYLRGTQESHPTQLWAVERTFQRRHQGQ